MAERTKFPTPARILKALERSQGLSAGKLAEKFGVERKPMLTALGKLRDEGKVATVGRGRAGMWVVGQ